MASLALRRPLRVIIIGPLAAVAWRLGLLYIFGPAQGLLADPARQSAKMLGVFSPGADAPRMYSSATALWGGLIAIGTLWTFAYVFLLPALPGSWWQRGVRFAAVAWTFMVPWFEFYLPWNVLREPAPLVALELVCWAGVMLVVGLTVAGLDALLSLTWSVATPTGREESDRSSGTPRAAAGA